MRETNRFVFIVGQKVREARYACEVTGTELYRDVRNLRGAENARGGTVSVEKHGRCIGRPLSLYSSRALDQRTNTLQAIRSDARTLACKRRTQTRAQARAHRLEQPPDQPAIHPTSHPTSQSDTQQPHNTHAIIRAPRIRPRLNAAAENFATDVPPFFFLHSYASIRYSLFVNSISIRRYILGSNPPPLPKGTPR